MAKALLILGGMATVLTGPRWGIAPLAWVAPVPYLIWARQARGWRAWSALFAVLLLGHGLQCVIFATPPVPAIGVIAFAPPLAILRVAAIGFGELVRRRLGEAAGITGYAVSTVVLDWLGYGASEFGAWMATANSQVEWLAFMQLASISGLAGMGALMAATAATVAMVSSAPAMSTAQRGRALATLGTVLTAAVGWGTYRLDQPLPGRSVMVGTVVTSVGPDERGLPSDAVLAANTDALFERTRLAASRGARIVVWNEIATVVHPADESAFTARATALAAELGVDLVLAYGVLEQTGPVLFDNKYLFISDRGEILDEYQKHHPVPGEPSIRGIGPLRVLHRPYGRVGGAICYDYDFPALAREHARAGADLVVVPSSDWRGIDPLHTYMARARGIEGGFALVRAVRWAPSGIFDAAGRPRGWMTAIDDNDGVLVAPVPVGQRPTVAASIGDLPVAAALAVVAGLSGLAFWRRKRSRTAESLATGSGRTAPRSSAASA